MKNFLLAGRVAAVGLLLFGLSIIEKSEAFHYQSYLSTSTRTMTTTTSLNSNNNVGKDGISARWNPEQAAEFVTWNVQGPEKAASQIAPMIKNWSGNDVGEFLTRMYLGEIDEERYTIAYHPSNVRNPQWIGLDNNDNGTKDDDDDDDDKEEDRDGIDILTSFFFKALPTESLLPEEITKFATYFLLKEHRWPSKIKTTRGNKKNESENNNNNNESFESDSFQQRGHASTIARIIGHVRNERLGYLTPEDVIAMVGTTIGEEEKQNNRVVYDLPLIEFYSNLGIKLTSMEKIIVVEGLANAGHFSPGVIARLVSSIEEITEEERVATIRHKKTLREASVIAAVAAASNNGSSDVSPSTPVQTPLSEIISPSGTKELGEFEARWLPEELLLDEGEGEQKGPVTSSVTTTTTTATAVGAEVGGNSNGRSSRIAR